MTHTQMRAHWPSAHFHGAHWAVSHWFTLIETIDEHAPRSAAVGSFATIAGLTGALAPAALTGASDTRVPLGGGWLN